MIQMHIDSDTREFQLSDIPSDWVAQHINNRRRSGVIPCIKLLIREEDVRLWLSVGPCPAGSLGGSPRELTKSERRVADFWDERVKRDEDVKVGEIMSFLQRLRSMI